MIFIPVINANDTFLLTRVIIVITNMTYLVKKVLLATIINIHECSAGGEACDAAEADAGCRQRVQPALHHITYSGALLHGPGHSVPQEQAGSGPPLL